MPRCPSEPELRKAFTLLELLLVLGIIGAIAAISMPAFKGFGQGNALAAAERQLADDIGLARQYAIKNRSVVYMVFAVPQTMPPQSFETAATRMAEFHEELQRSSSLRSLPELRARALRGFTNVATGLFSSYALYTETSLGDQPGQVRPRYLTDWRSLPDGIVFPQDMSFLIPPGRLPEFPVAAYPNGYVVPTLAAKAVPFPVAPRLGDPVGSVPRFPLPCLAFDATGRIVEFDTRTGLPSSAVPAEKYLALGFGSVLLPRQPNGNSKQPGPIDFSRPVDYLETPRFNHTNSIFRIAALTGRSKLFKPQTK